MSRGARLACAGGSAALPGGAVTAPRGDGTLPRSGGLGRRRRGAGGDARRELLGGGIRARQVRHRGPQRLQPAVRLSAHEQLHPLPPRHPRGARAPNAALFSRGVGTVLALAEAHHAVASGECELALGGGADSALHPVTWAELRRDEGEAASFRERERPCSHSARATAQPLAILERCEVFPGGMGSSPRSSPRGVPSWRWVLAWWVRAGTWKRSQRREGGLLGVPGRVIDASPLFGEALQPPPRWPRWRPWISFKVENCTAQPCW